MNIHADDIGLSIVLPREFLYAVVVCHILLLYMRFLHGMRARQRLITEYYSAGAVQGDYWKFKYESVRPAKTSIMFHQPITR